MGEIVYVLCGLASTMCAVLLINSYRKGRSPLLLWMALGFSGLALNNILLFVDLVLLPTSIDLTVIRTVPAVIGLLILVGGLIRETVS